MQKDIQLTGIGNALVDIEFEVNDAEISALNFSKGSMTLVDADTQLKILETLGDRTHYKCSGGSAANTIIAFSSFGGKSAYKTMLGMDEFGEFYSSEFRYLGIILDAAYTDLAPTGTCFVLISTDAERTMVTSLGATAMHSKIHINDEIIKRSEWIYIEGYKLTDPIGVEVVRHSIDIAKKYDTKIAVTFSDKFIVDVFRKDLDYVVENSDLVFCNEVEAMAYTNSSTRDEAIKNLFAMNKSIAMTLGSEGSIIKWEGETFSIPAYNAKAIDTTGAGDMFAGGFFYGITHFNDPLKAGHLASLASSRVVSQLGARLKESHTDLKNRILNEIK
jgi:sugar/nucleoside kinase (ribokinase family)